MVDGPRCCSHGATAAAAGLAVYRRNELATSEEDSADEAVRVRRAKRIPSWARPPALAAALVAQGKGDPDKVFAPGGGIGGGGGGRSVDLEAVFAGQPPKKRYRVRKSSGVWTADRLGWGEEVAYKRQMGFL
ncbi:hypothetical protein MMPV_000528 [Pyropia vietnamensis]